MGLLQQHPPPIDYQARRAHADQIAALTAAVQQARRVHPSPRPTELLVRKLWERLTGGDIAYAPEPLGIHPAHPGCLMFRRRLAVRDADLFHVAHQALRQHLQYEGPLTWTLHRLAEVELPDVRALLDHEARDGSAVDPHVPGNVSHSWWPSRDREG